MVRGWVGCKGMQGAALLKCEHVWFYGIRDHLCKVTIRSSLFPLTHLGIHTELGNRYCQSACLHSVAVLDLCNLRPRPILGRP